MPWVRIDENAMDHPKIGALPDGAFRLWVQGLAYCQKHLTDGVMPHHAVSRFLAYSPKRRDTLIDAGLWDRVAGGLLVHDYLAWNDSRADVVAKRDAAKERMRIAREQKRAQNVPANNGICSHERAREVLRDVTCITGGSTKKSEGGPGETAITRVQRFVERYQELHQHYLGVAYLGNPQKDYFAACELVAAFPDDMLEAIAVFGLNDADPFMANGTRTLTKLKSRASDYAQQLKAKKLA